MRYAWYLIFCIAFFTCQSDDKARKPIPSTGEYHRIVSFAPNITETLFALSFGDRVVGVTSFCNYPPEAKKISSIGGYTNPNFEMLIRLKPDLVILMKEHGRVIDFLKKHHIDFLLVDNHDLFSIQESILLIGKKCGRFGNAEKIVARIKKEIVPMTMEEKPPRVLLCVDRTDRGSGKIGRVYAAGRSTFYNDLLDASNMKNVIDGHIAYPQLSMEGIINLRPDIIIDFVPSAMHLSIKTVEEDWKILNMVPAIKNHMVFCLSEDYLMVPGPRLNMVLSDFKRIANELRRFSDAQH